MEIESTGATHSGAIRRAFALGLVGTTLLATLTACSPSRSLEAYCSVIEEHKERYINAMAAATGGEDLIGGIMQAVSAIGDIGQMWKEAAKVAPEEISADVEATAAAWDAQLKAAEKAASDPLAGLTAGLMSGITNAAAISRVDQYTAANCPGIGAAFVAVGDSEDDLAAASDDGETSPAAVFPRVDELEAFRWSPFEYDDGDIFMGPRTVALIEKAREGIVQVYGAENPLPVTVSPPVDADREVLGRAFGVQQRPGADSALIVTSMERKRSTGLQAGEQVVTMRVYDDSGTTVSDAWVSAFGGEQISGTALFGDTVHIAMSDESTREDIFLAVSASSGDVIWQMICSVPLGNYFWFSRATHHVILGADGTRVVECGDDLIGVAPNGDQIWSYTPERSQLTTGGTARVLPGDAERFAYDQSAASSQVDVYDISTGEPVALGLLEPLYDPVSGLLLTRPDGQRGGGDESLRVTDTATGEVLLRVSTSQVEALQGLTPLGAFDERLWFYTKDGLEIVSLRTGESDSLTPARDASVPHYEPYRNIPLVSGETWVLLGQTNGGSYPRVSGIYRDPAGAITTADLPPATR